MQVRASGILLHVTSLPSAFGVGDMGPWAFRFAEYLATLQQSYWQILPLTPTSPAIGNSPYSSASAFAGNFLLISPEVLVADGYLAPEDVPPFPEHDPGRAHYEQAEQFKTSLLQKAFIRNRSGLDTNYAFLRFVEHNAFWLDDYALFATLKDRFHGAMWIEWPTEYRDRLPDALAYWRKDAAEAILYEKFVQFIFFNQWRQLKEYCNDKGVSIIGDMPIYVTLDSADVWGNHAIFKLGPERTPEYVAGVPPDYFSATGQLWGNPVYDWDALGKTGYDWWIKRMAHALGLYDIIRLDHFRAFSAYWEVPATEKTAVNGEWIDGPGTRFFTSLLRRIPTLPLIAEDLGVITADVRELKDTYGFPGMVILQFCFGQNLPDNPYAPHNHTRNSVVYTGTHDNNTVNGWFYNEASPDDQHRFLKYAGLHNHDGQAHMIAIRLAMASVANTAIFPMQDILGLGGETRMNTPSSSNGNWMWRVRPEELDLHRAQHFFDFAKLYGRVCPA